MKRMLLLLISVALLLLCTACVQTPSSSEPTPTTTTTTAVHWDDQADWPALYVPEWPNLESSLTGFYGGSSTAEYTECMIYVKGTPETLDTYEQRLTDGDYFFDGDIRWENSSYTILIEECDDEDANYKLTVMLDEKAPLPEVFADVLPTYEGPGLLYITDEGKTGATLNLVGTTETGISNWFAALEKAGFAAEELPEEPYFGKYGEVYTKTTANATYTLEVKKLWASFDETRACGKIVFCLSYKETDK